ncbi:MAG: TonB-dependent siderophore receptor [Cellvibrio sp. 79]|nr:MAG: TonB-dependent siderophore receptor [Cellvibrio sp. 79]
MYTHKSRVFPKTPLAILMSLCLSPTFAAEQPGSAITEQQARAAATPQQGKIRTVTVTGQVEEVVYTGKSASASTKLNLGIKDTPQSVSVVTRKQIDDMGATNLGQLLLQTTGIILTGDNSERTNFSIRGFNMGDGWNSNLLQYDGIPLNVSNVAASKPDMALVESIEVLRGAAGLMQGSGEPSGAVNLIRKKPTLDFQANAAVTYGSWDMYRAEADVSNRLNESGSIRGRAVVAYQDANSYMDAVERNTSLVYGIITADLTENTELNISYKNQSEDSIGAHNLPRDPKTGEDLKLSRDNCSCNENDFWDKENEDVFIGVEHKFNEDWSIKGTYVRANINMDMVFTSLAPVPAAIFDPANPKGYLNKYAYQYDQTLDVYDVFTKGNFDLFGRSHEVVLGFNSQESDIPGRWTSFDYVMNDYTLWNRVGTAPKPILTVDLNTYSPYDVPYIAPRYELDGGQSFEDRKQTGSYIATRFNLADPLNLIMGVRQSDFEFDSRYKSNVTNQFVESRRTTYAKDNVATPYVGLTYAFTQTYTAYASFTDTFVVQNAKGRTPTDILKPIQGNVYEVGVKGSFNDDKLIASLAAFRTNQINRSIRDDSSIGQCLFNGAEGYCNISAGEVISEGVEAELRGEIFEGFNVSLGYTHNTTEYEKDPVNGGRVFNETTPEDIVRTFATYRFGNQLTIGGGANYQSEWLVGRYGSLSATQEAYWLVNLMASYPINDTLTVTFNADNALDEKYYSYLSTTSNRYGEPRNLKLSLRAKF